MIPVLGSPSPPPPQWYPPPPPACDCAHFWHMRAPKPSSVTRIASQRRPIRVTVQFFCGTIHMRPPKPSTVTRIASQTRPILVTVDTSQSKTTPT